jgi:hydrogenase-4 component B
MLIPEHAVVAAILVCLGGAVLALLCSGRRILAGWVTFGIVLVSAGLVGYAVGHVLTLGPGHPATFFEMPRVGFALRIYVDGLTAMFLLLAALIAVPASFYSILYMRHYPDYGVARYYPYFLVFLAAMYGLVSTTDMMWFFFIFWQMMNLPGYALIRFESRNPANVRAANKYLLMMQIACAITMLGAEMLAVGGTAAAGAQNLKYDFDSISANLPALLHEKPGLATLAFACFLAGFGIKMGMWPFGQVWLPDAHPAAPSPVSAMLSGVMIKTGVYGLLRYFLWLVPAGPASEFPVGRWGVVVAVLGTITLFTGTMQALKQEQSKRLLAFHSIGQIGYILLGAGACMTLLPVHTPVALGLATIGFFGALFHTLNHGLFKSLLFLNAGTMLFATGTQDLNKMGGLMRLMPVTAVTALIASFSISGVPLFNGFASKWSI